MKHSTQLANRFREVHLNGKWVAQTNYKILLDDITWEQATHKIGSLNTIAALTFHIDYYIGGVLDFLVNGKLEIRDKFSFDLPPIESEDDWTQLKNQLFDNAEKFAQQIELLSADKLEETFVQEAYGNYHRNMDSLIEHGYYHLGQIMLLKKLIQEGM